MTGMQPMLAGIMPSMRTIAGEAAADARLPCSGDDLPSRARRSHFTTTGDLTIDILDFEALEVFAVDKSAQSVTLVLPLAGDAVMVDGADHVRIRRTDMLWVARDDAVTLVWTTPARVLAIHLSRQRLQRVASRILGDARRVARLTCVFETDARMPVDLALNDLVTDTGRDQSDNDKDTSFIETLITALASNAAATDVFPCVRSITRAMRMVGENSDQIWDAEALAMAAGVTAPTLRRGFRACLGLSIGDYAQEARLQFAYRCMASGTDSRQIADVAASVGYRTASAFTRAYNRRFKESPSQTRSRVVRAMSGIER